MLPLNEIERLARRVSLLLPKHIVVWLTESVVGTVLATVADKILIEPIIDPNHWSPTLDASDFDGF